MKNYRTIIQIIILISICVGFASCNGTTHDQKDNTIISGIVTDAENYPMSDVEIVVDGITQKTDKNGTFLIDEIELGNESKVIRFSKPGYFDNYRTVDLSEELTQIQIALLPFGNKHGLRSNSTQMQNNRGGVLRLSDGSEIVFEAGSLSTSDGKTNVYACLTSPDEYVFASSIPGNGLKGIYEDETYQLIAYSLFTIEIQDYQQKPAKLTSPAILKTKIAVQDLEYMPEEMELWSFDEESAMWKFEKMAQKQGSYYVAEVDHFSSWMFGISTNQVAKVKGKVIDRSGRVIAGQNVIVGQTTSVTKNNGSYEAEVPANQTFFVGMKYKGFEIKMEAGPLSNGETLEMDLSVPPMTMVLGTITDCEGNKIGGQATLTWGEPDFSTNYTKSGDFELSIPSAVQSANLSIKVGDSIRTKEIKNPNKSTEIKAGKFEICIENGENQSDNVENDNSDKEDNKKEEKKPEKPKALNPVGVWNFYSRSDGKNLVSYHRFTINADGTYQEDYQPHGSTYIGGTKGTWQVNGNVITFTYVSGGGESYTIEGNVMSRKSDDGIVFKFKK